MSDDFVVFDQLSLSQAERMFKEAPRDIRGYVKKRWRKDLGKVNREMRRSHFSGPTGAHTVRSRTNKQRAKGPKAKRKLYNRLKPSLVVKRLKFGVGGNFGGYVVIGFKGALGEKNKPHFVAYFHEYGTKHMQARAPLASAWANHNGEKITETALSKAIDDWKRKHNG